MNKYIVLFIMAVFLIFSTPIQAGGGHHGGHHGGHGGHGGGHTQPDPQPDPQPESDPEPESTNNKNQDKGDHCDQPSRIFRPQCVN